MARRCVLSLTLVLSVLFRTQSQDSRIGAANELFKNQRWAEAAKAYELIVSDNPGDADAWRNLGTSYYQLKQYDRALQAMKKELSFSGSPTTMYNIACVSALTNRPDEALDWLDKAVSHNLSPFVFPEKDPDLRPVHDDPRFKRMIADMDRKRRPCLVSEEARQFDFWIGEWDVLNRQGQQAGTSVIESVSEGCGILERWTNRGGITGTSLNFYDSTTRQWHQYWMGATGSATRYEGSYSDGAMRFRTQVAGGNGAPSLLRLTFFNVDPNTVRQFAEQSNDGGKTWVVSYDLTYVRKTRAAGVH